MVQRVSQEGLEVAKQSQEGLEVAKLSRESLEDVALGAPIYGHDLPIPAWSEKSQSLYTPSNGYDELLSDTPPGPIEPIQSKKRSQRKRIFAVVFFLLVVACVVGGTVGGILTRKSKDKPRSSVASQPNSQVLGNGATGGSGSTDSTMHGGLLPASSDPSGCRGRLCPTILSTLAWPNKRFVFGLTIQKKVVYKSGNSSSWDPTWTDLGGDFELPPTVVSWGEGRIDILAVASNTRMYWKNFNSTGWSSNWTSLEGNFSGAPSAASWGPKRIDVFAQGTDGALWHNFLGEQDQNWVNWESLGGRFVGKPSVAAWGNQNLDIFVDGSDQGLWHLRWDGIWHPWESLSEFLGSDPVVVASATKLHGVFVQRSNGLLCWRGFQTAWLPWLPWQCLAGKTFESVPVPLVVSSERVDVLAVGPNDRLYHMSVVNSKWNQDCDDLGGPLNSAPAVLALPDNHTAVFGLDNHVEMFTSDWNSSQPAWTSLSGWRSLGGSFMPIT
jgi:hypothetical protein